MEKRLGIFVLHANLFITEKGLNSHMKEDACFKHCCSDCGKVFKLSSNLNSHMQTHRGMDEVIKNYHCGKCDKSFRRADVLKVHGKRHDNLSQFKCHCGKIFNRKDGLSMHMKRIHGNG